MWKFCGNGQFPQFWTILAFPQNCAFPQNFHTRKLGENSVFYAVLIIKIFGYCDNTWMFFSFYNENKKQQCLT